MTTNQLAYWNLQEQERTNRAKELETKRSNVVKEKETHRHNKEEEIVAGARAGAEAAKAVGSVVKDISTAGKNIGETFGNLFNIGGLIG